MALYAAPAPCCRPLTHSVVRRRKQWVLVGMEEGWGMKQTQFLSFRPSEVFKLKEVWVPSRQNEIWKNLIIWNIGSMEKTDIATESFAYNKSLNFELL